MSDPPSVSSSQPDSGRQARALREVATLSVGLPKPTTGSGEYVKNLKLKTPTKDVVKILEFQFLFKILMKAEGFQEGLQKRYLLRDVSGTTKTDLVQTDILNWSVKQMLKYLKELNMGANYS